MAQDYYELLGVSRSATEDELKRAYRKLARELHPDTSGGDPVAEARFKEISAAYETLRDPERRRRYDMFGPDGARMGQGAGTNQGDIFGGGFGDLFDVFFKNGPFANAQQSGPRRGNDVEITVEIEFEQALHGVGRPVTFRCAIPCDACEATGAAPGTSARTCKECSGTGQVRQVRQSLLGQVVTAAPCGTCRGLGTIIDVPCPHCRGEGRRDESHTVTVEVPPGVDDGTTLRITGAGGAAQRSGIRGDLYVHVRVKDHERFERRGSDLEMGLHIAFTQAALGAEITIDTLDGPEIIHVSPGMQTGKVYRLKGLGVPVVRGRGRGDLNVFIFVDTPTDLSKDEQDLLRDLARMRNEEISSVEPGLISRIRSSFG
jgi:molecular chaperone DnaJ